ncbi:MAG: hypothetical protein K8R31_00005 [Bacteroidales bacterium]|nr:hypothetical protein [Bacteroidales bacterium]
MKKYSVLIPVYLFIISLLTLFYSCENEIENIKPTCFIVSPVTGEEIIKGEVLTITINANDEDGIIKEVHLYIDDVEFFVSNTSSPYTFEWYTCDISIGEHKIEVEVIDDKDYMTDENVIVTVIDSVVTDFDGNEYTIVKIGEQIWLAENLKTTHYANGIAISLVESTEMWDNVSNADKAYCYYNNSSANGNTYGGLYTWAAVMNNDANSNVNLGDVQGICPDGWHVPSETEWNELIDYLSANGFFGVEGKALKSLSGWYSEENNGNGTDNYGFKALPAAWRNGFGTFGDLGYKTQFWTASEFDNSQAWYRMIAYYNSYVYSYYRTKDCGMSIRCLKD